MEIIIGNFFSLGSFLYLTGLIAAAFFFAMVGFKELKVNRHEGLVYIVLSLFFVGAHAIMMFSNLSNGSASDFNAGPGAWEWAIFLLGPALVILYMIFGFLSFCKMHFGEAVLKIGLGICLIGMLYFAGYHWPPEIKAPLVVLFGLIWFGIELRTDGQFE